jgi:hypothetical protein
MIVARDGVRLLHESTVRDTKQKQGPVLAGRIVLEKPAGRKVQVVPGVAE